MTCETSIPYSGVFPRNPAQQENLSALLNLARHFSHEAGISMGPGMPGGPDVFLVESGHQPNYFPSSSFFQKIFLESSLASSAREREVPSVAVFGFADQNLSTARFLTSNRVPAWNRSGFLKVGFSLQGVERSRVFRAIPVPDPDDWEREWERVRAYYLHQEVTCREAGTNIQENLREVEDLLARSYQRATNFADLNAFFIASLCIEIFGLPVFFFRYSDIQQEGLFAPLVHSVLARRREYVEGYNRIVKEGTGNLTPLPADHIPLWLHCPCGGKVPLTDDGEGGASGTCPACRELRTVPDLCRSSAAVRRALPSLGLNAITRHLVYFEALKTTVFLSGSGGGIRYGHIAKRLADELGFHYPLTVAVRSHDYYLGPAHISGLCECAELLGLQPHDLASPSARHVISARLEGLRNGVQAVSKGGSDRAASGNVGGRYLNCRTRVLMLKALFSLVPSTLDIFAVLGPARVGKAWESAANNAKFTDRAGTLYADTRTQVGDSCSGVFTDEEVRDLYTVIPDMEVRDET